MLQRGRSDGDQTSPLMPKGELKGRLDAPVILAQARIYRVYERVYEISQPL